MDKLVASGFIELTSATGAVPQDAPPPSARMPYLAYGSWTLHDATDGMGQNWSNSVLKFASQSVSPEGLQLRGTFTWRLDNELVGTEAVAGYYIAATREIDLEGESVSDPIQLALGSYSACLSADGRELSEGRWGSTAQQLDAGSPGRWAASR